MTFNSIPFVQDTSPNSQSDKNQLSHALTQALVSAYKHVTKRALYEIRCAMMTRRTGPTVSVTNGYT